MNVYIWYFSIFSFICQQELCKVYTKSITVSPLSRPPPVGERPRSYHLWPRKGGNSTVLSMNFKMLSRRYKTYKLDENLATHYWWNALWSLLAKIFEILLSFEVRIFPFLFSSSEAYSGHCSGSPFFLLVVFGYLFSSSRISFCTSGKWKWYCSGNCSGEIAHITNENRMAKLPARPINVAIVPRNKA